MKREKGKRRDRGQPSSPRPQGSEGRAEARGSIPADSEGRSRCSTVMAAGIGGVGPPPRPQGQATEATPRLLPVRAPGIRGGTPRSRSRRSSRAPQRRIGRTKYRRTKAECPAGKGGERGTADGRDASGPALSSSSPILRHKPLDTDLVMHHCDASQRRPRVFAGRGERSDDPICIAGCMRASSRPASRASYAGWRHERGTRCRAFAGASARRDRPRRDRSSGRSGDHVGKEARTACPCLKRGM